MRGREDASVTLGSGVQPARGRLLFLVRHGESTWNARQLVQGQTDTPGLTEEGREQAAACARRLSRTGVRALYSSDLRRAVETATPIAQALGITASVTRDLRERALGDAEGQPSSLLGPDRSGHSGGMVVDASAAPAGGESVRELYDRATRCAERLLGATSGDVVLVTHGGVVRVLVAWLEGVSPDDMAWGDVANGSCTELAVTVPELAVTVPELAG